MIAGLLLALAVVGPPAPASEPRSQIVTVTWDAQAKSCGVQVHGAQLGDPETDDTQAAIVRALPEKWKPTILHGTTNVPYKCVGGIVSALQKQGYGRIGFISEPPPPAPSR